jgi:hypothetical protein
VSILATTSETKTALAVLAINVAAKTTNKTTTNTLKNPFNTLLIRHLLLKTVNR